MTRMDRPTLEASRRYLRRRDKIGGYLPLLAMRPVDGEAWTRLWWMVRTLDDRSEAGSAVAELVADLERSLAPDYPQLTTELRDLARWTHVEAEIYGRGGVRTIFHVNTVFGRDLAALAPGEPVPDRRRPVVLAHYGLPGIVPTLVDFARILLAARGPA